MDTDELGMKLIEIISKITKDTADMLTAREIMEEGDVYSSFVDIIHSMALKGDIDLIPADDPMRLRMGWADINSDQVWEIHVSNFSKELKKIEGSEIIREALMDSNKKVILAKAMEVVCNAY